MTKPYLLMLRTFPAARRGQLLQLGCAALQQQEEFLPLGSFELASMALFLGQQFDGFFQVAEPGFQAPDSGAIFLQFAGHVEHREQPVGQCAPYPYAPWRMALTSVTMLGRAERRRCSRRRSAASCRRMRCVSAR